MIVREEMSSKVTIKEIAVIKKVHNFIEFFNPNIKILSIDLKEEILTIHMDNCSSVLQAEIYNLQKDIILYLDNEFQINLKKVNVISI